MFMSSCLPNQLTVQTKPAACPLSLLHLAVELSTSLQRGAQRCAQGQRQAPELHIAPRGTIPWGSGAARPGQGGQHVQREYSGLCLQQAPTSDPLCVGGVSRLRYTHGNSAACANREPEVRVCTNRFPPAPALSQQSEASLHPPLAVTHRQHRYCQTPRLAPQLPHCQQRVCPCPYPHQGWAQLTACPRDSWQNLPGKSLVINLVFVIL